MTAQTLEELAETCGLDPARLSAEVMGIPHTGTDRFGRAFGNEALSPPYHAVKVTGALFHTQGGLSVNEDARVRRREGGEIPNLFAAGGAAVGVSGKSDSGYLSGNGLLSAVVLGHIAGQSAAALTTNA